ncbi:MAG TPA: flavin reductase family protein [Candidatus Limnocylindria bacterium]|nr:flavin reductase family protein [Candidatus Limnocylindria bacterium]
MTAETTDRYEVARRALSRISHAVAIVGAAHGDERSCGTGTAMYVSLAPAMIAIAEHTGSRTTRLIRESGEFSLSLLHDSQQDLAVAAGKSAAGPDKFATLDIRTVDPPAGFHAPGVDGSIAVLWCRVVNTIPTGDHLLFVGEVAEHLVSDRHWDPLLRYGRRYYRLGHWTSDESPEGYPT